MDGSPAGDLFSIRNIGNQMTSALGSIEYGVNHLHSQLFIIMGHSDCGAITAARGDFTHLEPAIVKDLKSLKLRHVSSNIEGVEYNVHYQVRIAMQTFSKLIKEKKLLVIGAVYDFSNAMHQGAGKINIINVQGEKIDPKEAEKIFASN